MTNGSLATVRFLTFVGVIVLVALPLLLLACGAEEATERPTREPRERASDASDERDESQSEDRSERRGLTGRATREGSVETDREALVALYEATDGDNWLNNENWLTDAPLGEWYGIITGRNGRVLEIQLDANGLEGEIPAEIGVLDSLVDLNLDINVLRGPIPPELGDLVNLEKMNLVGNGLIGDLPRELARLSNLRDLVLPGNNLSGSIPSWLTELTDLQILYLAYNDFSGEIPRELGEMGSLVRLELGHNNLTGQIPAELGLLEDLVHLGLENNRLSGDIPDELEDLHSLLLLGVAGNPQLVGCVPSYLALQLDPSSDLGDVRVCGGRALSGPAATIAVAPKATRPGPAATPAPTWVPTNTPEPAPTRAAPVATSTPWPTPTRAAPVATSTPWPTPTRAAPVATSTPWPTPTRAPTLAPVTRPPSLEEYARQNAGGPGAIYVGDLRQLVGPAPEVELGNRDGNVPLDSLERHLWIYESDYYQELLDVARLSNPTPLTSLGKRIEIQLACISPFFVPCQLLENYFAPNVQRRTNGQVRFSIAPYHELGYRGGDALIDIRSGNLQAATIFGGYHLDRFPAFDVQNLLGTYSTSDDSYRGQTAILEDLEDLITKESAGLILNNSWYWGMDLFLICTSPVGTPKDLQGKTIGNSSSVSTILTWIGGIVAQTRSSIRRVQYPDIESELSSGNLDCIQGAAATVEQRRLGDVADSAIGPLPRLVISSNTISRATWDRIPADLQRIILEEAAKSELENLRLAPAVSDAQIDRLADGGVRHIPFSSEFHQLSRNAAVNSVIPDWVNRVGNTNAPIITDTFNRKLGPIVGMRINSDGTVTDLR